MLVACGGLWPVGHFVVGGRGAGCCSSITSSPWFELVLSGAFPEAPSLPHPHLIGCFILEASVASTDFLNTCECGLTLFPSPTNEI